MKKFLYAISLVAIVVLLAVSNFFQFRVSKYSGVADLPILDEKVDVYFDNFGIPHIEGRKSEDVYRALGYITAGERLFQMDLIRRAVSGKLSEVFGEKTLKVDKMMRKLRLRKNAQDLTEKYKDYANGKTHRYMQAYLEGVHYYIENNVLPLEFYLLGYRPEKFEVADIVGVTGYMALTFADGLTTDALFDDLKSKLSQEKFQALRLREKSDEYYFLPKRDMVRTKFIKDVHNVLDTISEYIPLFHGSNSWVLSGQRTKSGYPMLGNDPHIATSNPHIFYEAHIRSEELEVYGHYIPLNPFAVLGQTPELAWAVTMSLVNDLTLYYEKFDPQNPEQVMHKGEWVTVDRYTEKIYVKGADSVEIEVVMTPHGPLVDGTRFEIPGKSISLSWSVYHPENNVIGMMYDLPFSYTTEKFREAVSQSGAPGVNISWINKSGDIAWWSVGKYPKLPDGVPHDIVLNGWDGQNEIERYYTIDENPHQINPESGVIISGNYRPMDEQFLAIQGYWQPGGRFYRMVEKFKEKQVWSVDDMKALQTDDYVPAYKQLKNILLNSLADVKFNSKEQKAVKFFSEWSGQCDRESIGCSILHMWNFYNMKNLYIDELGKKGFETLGRTSDIWHSYKYLLFHLNHSFWDNIKTDRVESGKEILVKSFKEATFELSERLGKRVSGWHWGKLHTAEYFHLMGKQWPLNFLYDIGPVPAHGARYAINNLAHKAYLNDFTVAHGPATRRIIDMANSDYSWGIIPTGNSGNVFSEHYDDQIKLYHENKYRHQLMDWNYIKSLSKLELRTNK